MGVYLTRVHLAGIHLIGVYLTGLHLVGIHLISVYLTACTSWARTSGACTSWRVPHGHVPACPSCPSLSILPKPPNFQTACVTLGLLEDDREWIDCLTEAFVVAAGPQLRALFVTALVYGPIADPAALWDRFAANICDDLPCLLARRDDLPATEGPPRSTSRLWPVLTRRYPCKPRPHSRKL